METPLDINLRPFAATRSLRQTGRPAAEFEYVTNADTGSIGKLQGTHFISGDNPFNTGTLNIRFLSRGCELLALTRDRYRVVDTLPAPPAGILAADGGVTVLLAGGHAPVSYRHTGQNRWHREPEAAALAAPFAIARADMGQVSATIPSTSLKGEYNSRSTSLTTADAATLGNAMGKAYMALSDSAMTHRRYIQPVMARYRIRNKQGEPVYLSAPVLITPSTAMQGSEATFTLTGGNYNLASETVLRAESFALKLTPCADITPDEGWGDIIGSVDILVSPQLHLYLHGAAPLHRFGNFSATGGSVTLRLPGMTDSPLTAATGTRFHAMVTGLLDRIDSALLPENADRHDTMTEIAALCRILDTVTAEPSPDGRILDSLSPPHTFAALRGAAAGNTTIWGNLHVIPFNGYSPAELTAIPTATSTPVPAVSCVRFGDGESVVSPCTLSGYIPSSLSPLVTYPSPEASEISVSVGNRSVTLPLQVSPGGKWAYYLDPSALPIAFDTETDTFVIPSANPPSRHYPDAIVATGRGTARSPSALVRCPGEITGITPTALPISSWDFARANFYTFTLAGSCALTVNSNGNRLTAARIDSRSVTAPEAVAVTPDGVMAVADGDLLRLNSNRVTTVLTGVAADRIGWSQPRGDGFDTPATPSGELWCVNDSAAEILVTSTDGKRRYLRDDVAAGELLHSGEGLLSLTADGTITNLSHETDAESAIRHVRRFPMPRRDRKRFVTLTLPVYGTGLKGSIDMRADNGLGTGHSCSLTRLDINGDLNAPLTVTVPAPSRTHLSIIISLTGKNLRIDL